MFQNHLENVHIADTLAEPIDNGSTSHQKHWWAKLGSEKDLIKFFSRKWPSGDGKGLFVKLLTSFGEHILARQKLHYIVGVGDAELEIKKDIRRVIWCTQQTQDFRRNL